MNKMNTNLGPVSGHPSRRGFAAQPLNSILGLALLGLALLAASAHAQTVRFRSQTCRVTVPLNFNGSFTFTNVASVSSLVNPVDFSVSSFPSGALPAGLTSVSIVAALSGNPLPIDNGLPSTTVTTNLQITLNLDGTEHEGLYALNLNGTGGAVNNWPFYLQVASLWASPSNAVMNWSSGASWAAGVPPGANDDVVFGSDTAPPLVVANSIVETNITIASLRFSPSNSAAKFHTLLITNGITLNVVGTNGFGMLKDILGVFGSSGGMTITLAGNGGTLVVSNEQAKILDLVDNSQASTFDMSTLGNFASDVNQIALGDSVAWPFYRILNDQNAYGGQPRSCLPTVNFARTNVIKAIFADPNHYANSNDRHYSLTWLNTELSGSSTVPNINLGISNIFYCDGINLVGGNQRGNLQFNSAFTASNPIAIFRGTNGGRMSMFCISDGGGTNTANSNIKSTISFQSGTLDMLCDQFIIGRDRVQIQAAGTPNYQGFFLMGKGIVDANTAILGFREHAGAATNANYLYNGYCEGTITVTGGVFKVNNTLTLGYTTETNANGLGSGGNTEFGEATILGGGQLIANTILVGGPAYPNSKNNFITVSNLASLTISNTIAGTSQFLDNLNFANGSQLTLNLDIIGNPSWYVYTTNLNTTGSNTISIATIKNLGAASGNIPLISFTGGNGSFQGLTMPLGANGFLITSNNIGIWLGILTNVPKSIIWRGYAGSDWDHTSLNWLDPATGIHTNFANGDFVTFDDTSVPTTVHLGGAVAIVPGSVTMSNSVNAYVIDSASGGAIQGSATWQKSGTSSLEIDGSTTVAVQVNQGSLTGSASGSIGAAAVAAGASMDFSGSLGNGISCAGVARLSGSCSGTMAVLGGGVLTNVGTYSGAFSAAAGSLLVNSGSLNNCGNSTVASNAWFINGGNVQGLTLTIGGTLKDLGLGTILLKGDTPTVTRGLTISSGATFIPGGDGIGTTTVMADTSPNAFPGRVLLAAGSTNIFKVDLSNMSQSNTILRAAYLDWGNNEGSFSIDQGCILVITNIGAPPFAGGQSFNMFQYQDGTLPVLTPGTNHTFPSMILPGAPGPGLAWDTSQLATAPDHPTSAQGTIGVRAVATTPIAAGYSATHIQENVNYTNGVPAFTNNVIISELTWPANYIGWSLQTQVNPTFIGLSNNWTTVFGSWWGNDILVTNLYGPNAVFFRMAYPGSQ